MDKLKNDLKIVYQALCSLSVKGADVKTLSNVMDYIEGMLDKDYNTEKEGVDNGRDECERRA